jgi:LPS export ABC transporter protein LptC
MRRFKFAIFISILMVAGIALFSFWSNRRQVSQKEDRLPPILNEKADKCLEKIRFVEDKHGKRTWELEAKSIQQYQDQDMILAEEVKLTFYTDKGRCFVLTGKEGKMYQSTKDMSLIGDVVLTSDDGYRLKTHSADYHHQERKVTTADPVEIEGERVRLTGRGLLVDVEAQTFKILNEVKTRWRKAEEG